MLGDSGVAGDFARVAGSRRFGRAWIAFALPLFLAGCWDTEISDAVNDALGVPKQVTASGYVVSDAVVVGATVEVQCLNGTEFRAISDLTGRYAVSVPRELGSTCSFMASGGTVSGAPNIDVYYGIASTRAMALGLGGEPILHLSALSTLGTAMAARMMPSVLHAGISTIKLAERARLDVDGERAAAGLLVLTQLDASRV